jgi:hypothetical protein
MPMAYSAAFIYDSDASIGSNILENSLFSLWEAEKEFGVDKPKALGSIAWKVLEIAECTVMIIK